MARATTTPRRKPPAAPPPARLIERTPLLEWIAAGLGLVLTVGAVGYLVGEGLRPEAGPPVLMVSAERISPTPAGYAVDVQVQNRSRTTAAAVEIEGVLRAPGQEPETAAVTFDYVPGLSRRTGGLVFQADPRRFPLTLTAKGHVAP